MLSFSLVALSFKEKTMKVLLKEMDLPALYSIVYQQRTLVKKAFHLKRTSRNAFSKSARPCLKEFSINREISMRLKKKGPIIYRS